MPRKARIDAPGALHHITIRGIERKAIFRDDQDKEKFIGRLGTILRETRQLTISPSAVSKAIIRGQEMV